MAFGLWKLFSEAGGVVGASGVGIYDDDGAGDWAVRLEAEGLGLVEETISDASALDPVWSDVGAVGLAAADVVARLHSGVESDTSSVGWWCDENAGLDVSHLVEPALRLVGLIRAPDSGLRALWAETELLDDWLAVVDDVSRRLQLPAGSGADGEPDAVVLPQFVDREWVPEDFEAARLHWVEVMKGLSRKELYNLHKSTYGPGDVLAIPLVAGWGGVPGTYGVAVIRSCDWLGAIQAYYFRLFFPTLPTFDEVADQLRPETVLEGWTVREPVLPGVAKLIGQVTDFEIEQWPIALDYMADPWRMRDARLKPRKLGAEMTLLPVPDGTRPDELENLWVPDRTIAAYMGSRRLSELQGGNTMGTPEHFWNQNWGRPDYG